MMFNDIYILELFRASNPIEFKKCKSSLFRHLDLFFMNSYSWNPREFLSCCRFFFIYFLRIFKKSFAKKSSRKCGIEFFALKLVANFSSSKLLVWFLFDGQVTVEWCRLWKNMNFFLFVQNRTGFKVTGLSPD